MAVLRKPPYDPDQNRYPKWVNGVIVKNKEEHDALLAKAAVAIAAEVSKEDAESKAASVKMEYSEDGGKTWSAPVSDKGTLVSQAEALGLEVDKRWGVERLKTEIAAKQKAA